MRNFLVRWEIDIEAEDAVAAAKKAQAIQRDPSSIATCFEVYEGSSMVEVDLEGAPENLNGPHKTALEKLLHQVIYGDFLGDNSDDLTLALRARAEYVVMQEALGQGEAT